MHVSGADRHPWESTLNPMSILWSIVFPCCVAAALLYSHYAVAGIVETHTSTVVAPILKQIKYAHQGLNGKLAREHLATRLDAYDSNHPFCIRHDVMFTGLAR